MPSDAYYQKIYDAEDKVKAELNRKQKDHENFHEELLKENERYILIQTIKRLNKENAELKEEIEELKITAYLEGGGEI